MWRAWWIKNSNSDINVETISQITDTVCPFHEQYTESNASNYINTIILLVESG